MDWKKPLKGFATPLVIGGILFVLINGVGVIKPKPSLGAMVVVDTSRLIRAASESFARGVEPRLGVDNPSILTKKLEAYKNALVKALNEFAIQNNCLVFTANQVFGNIPDATEAFVTFLNEENPQ